MDAERPLSHMYQAALPADLLTSWWETSERLWKAPMLLEDVHNVQI